jgi:D-psicose/D-tagatose/L-ribulose 3-epimerase
MNKIGIYYAYWTQEWDVDFHPYVDKAADLGFDILEVNGGTVGTMSSQARKALVQHAQERNIGLSYCIGLKAENDPSSPDAATRRSGIATLQRMCEGIGEMGGGNLSGILYSTWPTKMPKGVSDKRPWIDRSIESIKEAAKAAEANNVTMNMEVVNRFEQFLFNTAAEAVEYVRAVDSPNVKILLDSFHMNIEEDSIGGAIRTAGAHLGHIHLGENNRRPPGRGNFPWGEFESALKEIGFTGAQVMEPFMVPGGQVGSDIAVWRDLSVGLDLDEEAAASCAFMRAQVAAA